MLILMSFFILNEISSSIKGLKNFVDFNLHPLKLQNLENKFP